MAIRMRRGNEADFDPSKMLPGEWAVSTDTKYVRMCFSPGIVLRMATYEAFESDMAEMRKILSECQSIQTAVELIQKNVTNSELVNENYVKEAKQYRDEAEQFRNEASMFAPEGYEDLVKNVSNNTVKIDTIIEKAELNIKNNAKGSNIHLTDSSDSNVVALELYGKTEQNAYTGKNLFTFPNVYYNGTGLNITKSTDGTYLLNGTSTGAELRFYDGYNSINKRLVVPNGTYKIVATINGEEITSTSTFAVITNGTTYASHYGTSFEITDGFAISSMAVNLTVGKNYTNSELKIMVCKQSEDDVWEPYVGGKPSPSPDYPQEIKSVKGKNLLDCRGLVETTKNNVTFTPVKDDNGNLLYINVNGTASANSIYDIKTNETLSKGKYILNGCPSGGSSTTYQLDCYEPDKPSLIDTGNGVDITLFDDTMFAMLARIVIRSGTTVSNLRFYPMIREASITDGTYVPYGLLRIKTQGMNIAKEFTQNGFRSVSVGEKITSLTANTLRLMSDTFNNDDYYINSTKSNLQVYVAYADENYKITSTKDWLNVPCAIPKATNGTYVRFQFRYADNSTITSDTEIIIAKGLGATDYIPYQSTEITLSEPIELNGLNGVYDVVTSDGVTRRFAKVVFDGSDDESWVKHAGRNNTYWIHHSDKLKDGISLCSHYKETIPDKFVNYDYCYNNGDEIMIRDKDCNTLEEWKTKLQSNPITIVYELATPTTEELQTDFTVLKTFYPETYVSNDADCDMSITYTADAKNYIDNKIALLTTAIYNNI